MSNQMKGLIYFYITDLRFSLTVFWIVLLNSLFISIGIDYVLSINGVKSDMFFSLSMALYVYTGIIGFLAVNQHIPFSIKIGSTRKSIFFSLGLFFAGLSMAKGLLANSIQLIIELFQEKLRNSTFTFIHLGQLIDGSWLTKVLIDASLMFFLFSTFFLIGLIFYKFGLVGGMGLMGVLIVVIITGFSSGWLIDFFIYIYQSLSAALFVKLILISLVIYSLTWLLLRRITVVSTR